MYVQGNFFQNIGSITLFAVIGTAISAFIVGGGIYFLGQVRIVEVSVNNAGAARACSECKPIYREHVCSVNNVYLFIVKNLSCSRNVDTIRLHSYDS